MKRRMPRAAGLLCRLQWFGYQCRSALGNAGLGVCAVLLAAAFVEAAIVAPAVRGNDARLAQLAAGLAAGKQTLARLQEGERANAEAVRHRGDLWDILERHHLSPGEVRHRQMPGKKNRPGQHLVSFPSTGNYVGFKAALKELETLPDVGVDMFSLRRKSHTDRVLAIDMTLSVVAPLPKKDRKEVSR